MMQNIWPKSFIGLSRVRANPSQLLQGHELRSITQSKHTSPPFRFLSLSQTCIQWSRAHRRGVLSISHFSNWIKRCPPPQFFRRRRRPSTTLDYKTEILNLAPIQTIIKAHLAYFQSLHKFSSSQLSPSKESNIAWLTGRAGPVGW